MKSFNSTPRQIALIDLQTEFKLKRKRKGVTWVDFIKSKNGTLIEVLDRRVKDFNVNDYYLRFCKYKNNKNK